MFGKALLTHSSHHTFSIDISRYEDKKKHFNASFDQIIAQ
jgi:hypothetical protein